MPARRHAVHQVVDDRAALTPGSAWWAYLRHSPGDRQDITSQRRAVREYGEARGLVVARMFEDAGESGSSVEGRDGFSAMIAASKESPKSAVGVLVWDLSRFARNDLESQFYRADLRLRGFAVVSIADDIPSGNLGPVMEALLDFKNRVFLEDLSKNIRRGIRDVVLKEVEVNGKKVTGLSGGGFPPRGYRAVRVETGRRHGGEARVNAYWEIDPEGRERVALARRLFAEGCAIAAIHRETRLFSTLASYKDFFRNPTYTGQRRVGGLVVENAHPAYDSPEQYAAIVARAGAYKPRDRSGAGRPTNGAMLSGLLVCGVCGRPMWAHTDSGVNFYRCANRDSAARLADKLCASKSIRAPRLHPVILSVLRERVFTPEALRAAVNQINERRHSRRSESPTEMLEVTRELVRLRREISNLVDSIAEGTAPRSITSALTAREQKQTELEARLRAAQTRQASDRALIVTDAQLVAVAAQLRDALADTDPVVQAAIVRAYVTRVTTWPDRVQVEYAIGPDDLVGGCEAPIGSLSKYPRRDGEITILSLLSTLPAAVHVPPVHTPTLATLARRADVLRLVGEGASYTMIARQLGISTSAVSQIVKRARHKTSQ